MLKNLPAMQETGDQECRIPGSGRSPGEEMKNHCSILAWRIPWTEEADGLQSMQLQRVGHDLAAKPPPPPHTGLYTKPKGFTCNNKKTGNSSVHQEENGQTSCGISIQRAHYSPQLNNTKE